MPKIYTKVGDGGETSLWGGQRVSKSNPQVSAYGDVDELNTVIGLAISALPTTKNFTGLRRSLQKIQEELFVVGAILASPPQIAQRLAPPFDVGIPPQAPHRLEREIDRMTEQTKPLKHFILPGGAPAGAWLHFARSVCRRAERETVGLRERVDVPVSVIVYLNRLSDFLFVSARWVNHQLKIAETEWLGLSKGAKA
jgi:cob(I)alamin adenosyltransferase